MSKINYNQIKPNTFILPKKHKYFDNICIYKSGNFLISIHQTFSKIIKDEQVYELMQFNQKTFSKRQRSKVLKFLLKKYV